MREDLPELPYYICRDGERRSILLVKLANIPQARRNARGVIVQDRLNLVIRNFRWDERIVVDEIIDAHAGQPARLIERVLNRCAEIQIDDTAPINGRHSPVAHLIGRYLTGEFGNRDVVREIEAARLTEHFLQLMRQRRQAAPIVRHDPVH